jgi:hypothetical protein
MAIFDVDDVWWTLLAERLDSIECVCVCVTILLLLRKSAGWPLYAVSGWLDSCDFMGRGRGGLGIHSVS